MRPMEFGHNYCQCVIFYAFGFTVLLLWNALFPIRIMRRKSFLSEIRRLFLVYFHEIRRIIIFYSSFIRLLNRPCAIFYISPKLLHNFPVWSSFVCSWTAVYLLFCHNFTYLLCIHEFIPFSSFFHLLQWDFVISISPFRMAYFWPNRCEFSSISKSLFYVFEWLNDLNNLTHKKVLLDGIFFSRWHNYANYCISHEIQTIAF